jgi:hypothetical protein
MLGFGLRSSCPCHANQQQEKECGGRKEAGRDTARRRGHFSASCSQVLRDVDKNTEFYQRIPLWKVNLRPLAKASQ